MYIIKLYFDYTTNYTFCKGDFTPFKNFVLMLPFIIQKGVIIDKKYLYRF